jgi:hypothetical protein
MTALGLFSMAMDTGRCLACGPIGPCGPIGKWHGLAGKGLTGKGLSVCLLAGRNKTSGTHAGM